MDENNLLWVDVETTGLYPEYDLLLEVGLIATTPNLEIIDQIAVAISYDHIPLEKIIEMCPPNVKEMHQASRLFDAIQYTGRPAKEAERRLLHFAQAMTVPQKSPMCGSSVAFDRGFLQVFMPTLLSHFHYRNIDVSTLKELAQRWNNAVWTNRPSDENKSHRALDDLIHSIQELHHYKRNLVRCN